MTLKTYDYLTMIKKNLSDFEYAKEYYKLTLKDFKKNKDLDYFMTILNLIAQVQSKENFEKITGFNYSILFDKKNNIKDLLSTLQIFVKLKGKKTTAEESGLSIPTINNVFKDNKNITIFTVEKLLNLFKLNINYSININNSKII